MGREMIEQTADFARPAMHFARLDKSARLRTVLEFLQGCGCRGATTRDIIQKCGVCAVNSIISELRRNGCRITCEFDIRTETATIYRYRLEQE
jgi:hypothetical protein